MLLLLSPEAHIPTKVVRWDDLESHCQKEFPSHCQEQQRRQWLAELDRQVEERRVARERERLQSLSVETADDIKEAARAMGVERESCAAKCDVKSASFGRGRGLADLLGKQNTDSAAKRQQQLELQVG